MKAQIITTPAGERMVVLPEAEYLVLVEAAELADDIAAVERFKARLASGTEELVPSDVANAILDGANPIRAWREHRGMTAKDLATRTELAPAYLSQIETGKREGGIETLRKIADALDLTLDDVVA